MKRTDSKHNSLWSSRITGVEAWASTWSNEPQPRHAHDFFQLSLTRRGSGRVRRERRVADALVGHCVVLHPEEVHELQPVPEAAWAFDTLYLPTNRVVGGVSGHTDTHPYFGYSSLADAELVTRFTTLHGAVVRGDDVLAQDVCLATLLQCLATHVGAGSPPPRPPANRAGLERVRDFLDGSFEGGVTLAQLAAVAGIGEYHLVRSFRQRYGLPPHAYHVQVRVRRARALLREGVAVAEVALRTGFADQAHLTRQFKKLVGVTPGHFRNRSGRT